MMKDFKIATWNLERPKANSNKTKLALAQIQEINASVWVFTESSDAMDLDADFSVVNSEEFHHMPNENWVSIHSKFPIVNQIKTLDSKRTCCVLVKAPMGDVIIYGTIIPYHNAGVSGNRYPVSGYKVWEYHAEDILAQSIDWLNIQKQYPNIPFVLIGDFNQTRDPLPMGYGTKAVRELMGNELEKNNLTCLTGIDFGATGDLTLDPKKQRIRRNVDHICTSTQLLTKYPNYTISAWDHFTKDGKYMSDHNGVCLEIKLN